MVHPHQRSDWPAKSFRGLEVLANEISRRLQKAHCLQHARLFRRQSFAELSAHFKAPDRRRVLRRHGASARAVKKDVAANLDYYRSVRWRRAGSDDILSRSHSERVTRGTRETFHHYRAMGSP